MKMDMYRDWILMIPHILVVVVGIGIIAILLVVVIRGDAKSSELYYLDYCAGPNDLDLFIDPNNSVFSMENCEFIDPAFPNKSFFIEHFCTDSSCSKCSNTELRDPNAGRLLSLINKNSLGEQE